MTALLLSDSDRSDNRGMTHDTPRACAHEPACPAAEAFDRDAAHVMRTHPEQGWSLLCNGVILFDDFGDIGTDMGSHASPRASMRSASPHR